MCFVLKKNIQSVRETQTEINAADMGHANAKILFL